MAGGRSVGRLGTISNRKLSPRKALVALGSATEAYWICCFAELISTSELNCSQSELFASGVLQYRTIYPLSGSSVSVFLPNKVSRPANLLLLVVVVG